MLKAVVIGFSQIKLPFVGKIIVKVIFLKPIQQIASIGRRLIIVSPLSGDVLVIVWKP